MFGRKAQSRKQRAALEAAKKLGPPPHPQRPVTAQLIREESQEQRPDVDYYAPLEGKRWVSPIPELVAAGVPNAAINGMMHRPESEWPTLAKQLLAEHGVN